MTWRRADWHLTWRERARRTWRKALSRRRTVRRHAVARRRRRPSESAVAWHSTWAAWEAVRTTRALEARLLRKLIRRRRALRKAVGWVGRLLMEVWRRLVMRWLRWLRRLLWSLRRARRLYND